MQLFSEMGFEETTIDDIAVAAGVSRRSFFRYFSSKSDLMAQGIVSYGILIAESIERSPGNCPLPELLKRTVLDVAQQAAAHPRSRMVMHIASRSPAAREAQLSRMGEVQERVAQSFALRTKAARRSGTAAQVLASLTLSLLDVTLHSWFESGHREISAAVEQTFAAAGRVLCPQVSGC